MDGELKTPELLDNEAKIETARRIAISKVAYELEEILIRENMSVGDLLEIFGLFTGRANRVFESIKIKEIKDTYAKV